MANWWDEIPEEDPVLEKKANALANAIAFLPGCRETKVEWCKEQVSLIEAEADSVGKTHGKERSGEIRRLAIRWWRWHFSKQTGAWRDRETFRKGRDLWIKANPWFKQPDLDPGLRRTTLAREALRDIHESGFVGHEDGFWEKVDERVRELEEISAPISDHLKVVSTDG